MRRESALITAAVFLTVFALAVPTPSAAGTLATLVKEQGNGSRFKMQAQGASHNLHVGLIKVDDAAGRVVIEVFASADMGDPLWQQFVVAFKGDRPTVAAGYIQMGKRPPMIMPEKYLAGTENLDVSLFLLSERELRSGSRQGLKEVGQETITTPAGTVKCSRYLVEKPNQKLDIWISDEARPIGLVKMVSAGKKPNDNYKLELEELLSGIVAKIDAKRAIPLSDEMKKLLEGK